jgi:DNA-binding NtrC family response regulator
MLKPGAVSSSLNPISGHVIATYSPTAPFSALVVEPNELDMSGIVSALSGSGFRVSATDNYTDAKALLSTHPPLVLVTEVRLGAYNGLQLALRAGSVTPRVTIIVTSGYPDRVLQRDAERVGATFALKPFDAPELLAAVYRTALRRPDASGALEPIRAPFERRRSERRQSAGAMAVERRQMNRRRDIAGLLVRAAALS